jgi:hypothetical protein
MKKRKFLADLEERLEDKEFEFDEIERIINDYESLIDEAVEDKKNEAEFIETLGSVKEIVNNLLKTLPKAKRREHILVALSPFIATISFFLLGFFFDAWHPGWLVFLGIPIVALLTESRNPKRFIGIFPIAYTVFYVLIGTYGDLPFITNFIDYVSGGTSIQIGIFWHPLWAGYIYTAVLAYLFEDSIRNKLIGLLTFALVTAYIALELFLGFNLWHLLLIAAVVVISIANGTIGFIIDIKLETPSERAITFATLFTALVVTALFFILGFLVDAWAVAWVLFLLIPVVAIGVSQKVGAEKFEFTAYTPFIATILFFLTGYYFDLFAISWLFFLLIPISGIIEDQVKPKKRK